MHAGPSSNQTGSKVLKAPARAASIDFLYADPPFNTGQAKRSPARCTQGRARRRDAEYADDFGTTADFVAWLREQLLASIPAIKPTGLMCIHVDWRTSHHVRLLLDDLLGADRFVNHLIWSYGPWRLLAAAICPASMTTCCCTASTPAKYWFEPPACFPRRASACAARPRRPPTSSTSHPSTTWPGNARATRRRSRWALLELLVKACCPPGGDSARSVLRGAAPRSSPLHDPGAPPIGPGHQPGCGPPSRGGRLNGIRRSGVGCTACGFACAGLYSRRIVNVNVKHRRGRNSLRWFRRCWSVHFVEHWLGHRDQGRAPSEADAGRAPTSSSSPARDVRRRCVLGRLLLLLSCTSWPTTGRGP